jgi:hypothetical protein
VIFITKIIILAERTQFAFSATRHGGETLAVIIKNIAMKKHFIIFAFIILGCNSKEAKSINASDVIISATLLKFSQLNDAEKSDMIFDKCCCHPHNWNQGENCVEKENAFYVKAKINISLLAYLAESDAFPRKHLLDPNPHFLYGKYVNRWAFLDDKETPICETSKFDGHNSFALSKLDSIDNIIIGPLPEKPKKMIIEILQSKNYPGINPESLIK